MNMKHNTAYEAVAELLDDETVINEMKSYAKDRSLIDSMVTLRAKNGITQINLAQKLGWSHAKLDRFENSSDSNLKIGMISEYCSALHLTLDIQIKPKNNPTL